MSIGRETSSGGPDFSSMAKRYKVSRRRVLIDTFTCAAIKRRMFQVCSLSIKQYVGVGDRRRDSDHDNDSSSCVRTDPVAGTFNGHGKLQLHGISALSILLSLVIFCCCFASRFC